MRVLVSSHRLPEFDREAGSKRLLDLLELFGGQGAHVTYAAPEGPSGRYGRTMRQCGVEVVETDVVTLVGTGAYDIVLIPFWHHAEAILPAIRRACPAARIIVDSVDLHFVRESRRVFTGIARGRRSSMLDGLYGDELVRELNVYAAADAVLTVSEKEAALLADLVPGITACTVPQRIEGVYESPGLDSRRGLLFVANFLHHPNIEAAEFLAEEILPNLPMGLLEKHPLQIVGNALGPAVISLFDRHVGVRLIGWVPSVRPYLDAARVCLAPLLSGAGTKRKLLEAMAHGLPAVTTPIGAEGMAVEHERELLVATTPEELVAAVVRAVDDIELANRLVTAGRAYVEAHHGSAVVAAALADATEAALHARPRPRMFANEVESGSGATRYQRLVERVRRTAPRVVPAGSVVAVISKGDEALMRLEGLDVRHFPPSANRGYLGYNPTDLNAAIKCLQEAIDQGAQYLVVPEPYRWWFHHYKGFREHLESRFKVEDEPDAFVLVDLRVAAEVSAAIVEEATATRRGHQRPTPKVVERLRPLVVPSVSSSVRPLRVLVIGVYLATEQTNVEDVAAVLAEPSLHEVDQRWVALGGPPPSAALGTLTVDIVLERRPKFQIVNTLLDTIDLLGFDYLLLVDDDVVLPHGFVDELLTLQSSLGFALAQPARTSTSYIDIPIVERQPGVLARETSFVEIGPVLSIHRDAFDVVLPFDLTSPMGWGYENVWALEIPKRGMRMGIIDAVPVDHSLRKPVEHYSWDAADEGRRALLASRAHMPLEECYRVHRVIPITASASV